MPSRCSPVVDGDDDDLAPSCELLAAELVTGPVLEIAVVDVKHNREQLGGRTFYLQDKKNVTCNFKVTTKLLVEIIKKAPLKA